MRLCNLPGEKRLIKLINRPEWEAGQIPTALVTAISTLNQLRLAPQHLIQPQTLPNSSSAFSLNLAQ
ncbi:hypothetical protein PPACK8108_LOCUS8525 [Phakopsora pachyrhizi]|uniref:Uncharacterized protein n=1 Tax=Phakopsora pachyrhizi TaxID=170000 RepID=A0AAV0AWF1_PHAPC|nr:hypothetical protein PPACK8108_LOCUS8525 [Phakopsora pachyrhizi]